MLFEQYQILISFTGLKLWNEFLNTNEIQITIFSICFYNLFLQSSNNLFLRKVKSKLLDTENEVRYF